MFFVFLSSLAFAQKGGTLVYDPDGDGVPYALDQCPGWDDTVDLNADGTPDCAQTLLAGAHINSSADTADWSVTTGAFDTEDAAGWSRSGSLRANNVTSGCTAVDGGREHDVYFNTKVRSGHGSVGCFVFEYDDWSDCTGGLGASTSSVFWAWPATGWNVIGGALTLRADTEAVLVTCVSQTTSTGTMETLYDSFLLADVDASLGDTEDGMD